MPSIPPIIRAKLNLDPWMHKCCIDPTHKGKIDWHHNFKYQFVRNDWWSILPLCLVCHDQARNSKFKERLDWIMAIRGGEEMTSDIRINYPKSDFPQRKKYLSTVFKTAVL